MEIVNFARLPKKIQSIYPVYLQVIIQKLNYSAELTILDSFIKKIAQSLKKCQYFPLLA